MSKKFNQLLKDSFQNDCQKCLLRLQRNISMILFAEKKLFIKIGLFLRKLFPIFTEIFWQASQKFNMGVQGNILMKNCFFSLYQKKCRPLGWRFWRVCKKAFHVSRRTFWGISTWEKKLFLVLKSDRENFGLLSNRQPAGLSKMISTSTKERFDGFFLEKQKFYSTFSAFIRKIYPTIEGKF